MTCLQFRHDAGKDVDGARQRSLRLLWLCCCATASLAPGHATHLIRRPLMLLRRTLLWRRSRLLRTLQAPRDTAWPPWTATGLHRRPFLLLLAWEAGRNTRRLQAGCLTLLARGGGSARLRRPLLLLAWEADLNIRRLPAGGTLLTARRAGCRSCPGAGSCCKQ